MGKRHSPEQIVRKLRQAEAKLSAQATVPGVARQLGISKATFHRWRNQYGGMSSSEAVAYWRRKCWLKSTETTTTVSDRTPLWATGHRRRLQRRAG